MSKLPNGWRKWPEDKPNKDGDYWVIDLNGRIMVDYFYTDHQKWKSEYRYGLEEPEWIYFQPYCVPAGPNDILNAGCPNGTYNKVRMDFDNPIKAKQIWMVEI